MAIHRITDFGKTYRHVQRYRQLLTVLIRYGFGELLDGLKVEQMLEIGMQMVSPQRREKLETLTRPERVRMMLEELGPTFVKMGQVLSTRSDLVPIAFLRELEKLQSNVAPFEFASVKQIVESELGAPLEDRFHSFDVQPLAAASIGQVHRAILKRDDEPDGVAVVVKVQRPGVRKTIEVDLEIMLHLAGLMEKYFEGWDVQQPTKIIDELSYTMEKEIDYTVEATHMERFAHQFKDDPTVYVPCVYREASTTRVLVMEYIAGVSSQDPQRLRDDGFDLPELARRGGELLMKQIFVHGFFHADPHPGNIFVLPRHVICYLDFGMMGRIDRRGREAVADLVVGVVRHDETSVVDAILALTIAEEEPDRQMLERDAIDFMDQYLYRPLKELDFGKLLQELLQVSSRHRLRIAPDQFLMLKALGTCEGLGKSLDPDFDMTQRAAPFVERLCRDRYSPIRIAREFYSSGYQFVRLLQEIPGELREILRQTKHGKIKIEFEHMGLEPMIGAHERISNRLAFSIVLSSLVIGSSLIVLSKVPPLWNEIPIIGLGGFLVAGIMAFWLLLSILKHGKM